jgi:hypothetical protein
MSEDCVLDLIKTIGHSAMTKVGQTRREDRDIYVWVHICSFHNYIRFNVDATCNISECN